MRDRIRHSSHSLRGFTLIELMITVAVVGILAAVAYPSYLSQVRKGKRAECRAGLYQAMQQQERYFTQYNRYYDIPSSGMSLIKSSSGDSVGKSACTMSTTLSNSSTTLVLTATPQYSGDNVTALTMDNSGNKGCTYNGTAYASAAGTAAQKDCWP